MKLKEVQEVGSRGVLFTFEFGDSVYLINTSDKLFLCDTSEGHEEMEVVKSYIRQNNLENKLLYVFNSHSDWDHYFGNGCFTQNEIIGHILCRRRMKERIDFDLYRYNKNYHIKLPTITFSDRLVFPDSDIEFIFTPGHTLCSSICIDHNDQVMYVGDLLETPIPIINDTNIEKYIESLEFIKSLKPKTIITTHSQIVSNDLIDEHLNYLHDFIKGKYLTFSNEYAPLRHSFNMKNYLLLKLEENIKIILNEKFNYKEYKIDLWNFLVKKHQFVNKRFWDLRDISYIELKKDLEEYYALNYQ